MRKFYLLLILMLSVFCGCSSPKDIHILESSDFTIPLYAEEVVESIIEPTPTVCETQKVEPQVELTKIEAYLKTLTYIELDEYQKTGVVNSFSNESEYIKSLKLDFRNKLIEYKWGTDTLLYNYTTDLLYLKTDNDWVFARGEYAVPSFNLEAYDNVYDFIQGISNNIISANSTYYTSGEFLYFETDTFNLIMNTKSMYIPTSLIAEVVYESSGVECFTQQILNITQVSNSELLIPDIE